MRTSFEGVEYFTKSTDYLYEQDLRSITDLEEAITNRKASLQPGEILTYRIDYDNQFCFEVLGPLTDKYREEEARMELERKDKELSILVSQLEAQQKYSIDLHEKIMKTKADIEKSRKSK